MNLPSRMLCVDDDEAVLNGIKTEMARQRVDVIAASSMNTALYLFNHSKFDVAMVELEFAEMPGLVMIQKWRDHELREKRATGSIVTAGNNRRKEDEHLIAELGDIELIGKSAPPQHMMSSIAKAGFNREQSMEFKGLLEDLQREIRSKRDVKRMVQLVQSRVPNKMAKGLNYLCQRLEREERFSDAVQVLEELKRVHPDYQRDLSVMSTGARLLMRQKKFPEAQRIMEAAQKLAPQNLQRMADLAVLYLELQQPDKSLEQYKQLISYHPEKPQIKFDALGSLFAHGFGEHARMLCRGSLTPEEVMRHYNNKGVLEAKSGKYREALQSYEQALQLYPEFKGAYRVMFNAAISCMKLGGERDLRMAQNLLAQCMQINPAFEKAFALKLRLNQRLTRLGMPTKP